MFLRWYRKKIAESVADKMAYMGTCPNERDVILSIIAPKDYKRNKGIHCNFFKKQDVTLETDSDKVVLTIKKSDNKNGSITRIKNIREDINFKDRLSHNNRR